MKHAYHKIEKAKQNRRLLKSLIPKFLILLRNKIKFERRFPSAYVDMEAIVEKGAEIGKACIIRKGCLIGSNVKIGRNTTLGNLTTLSGNGRITIGKFCSIAPECCFWSENHVMNMTSRFPFEQFHLGQEHEFQEHEADEISIGNDVWIGRRAIVLPGAKIDDGCVVAAGSIVGKGEYGAYSLIAGTPGKIIKKLLPDDKVEELSCLKWWNETDEKIFSELMPFLHERH